MNLYPFTPYASEGETFAEAITRCMNLIGDDDAAIIMDHDIMPGTVRDWFPRVQAHLKNGMQFGTCLTNRLYSGYQIAEDAPQTNDDLEHANYGKKLTEANSGQYDIITDGKLASGHFFVITKAAWNRMGALETKTIIKVDNEIHEKMKAAGIDLWLMRDVYVYHRYRFGDRNDTAHLEKPIFPTESEQEAAIDPAMRKVCYTVITNGYDNLKQPQLITPGWEYLLFTDQPERFEANKGIWKVMAVEPEENPILLQRRLKAICPIKAEKGRLLRTVYIDGTHTVLGDLDEFVKATGHQWGTFTTKQHPERNCAYQDAETCEKLGKDTPANIKKTVAFLRKEKFAKDAGLSETGILIRDYNDPAGSSQLSRAMKQWEKMFRFYSHRDQLTLSYVLSKYPKLKHLRAPGNSFNTYFSKQTHLNVPSKVVEPKVATPPVAVAVPSPQSQPVEYMVPARKLSERFALNIYVTANASQLNLIQPFIENALGSNPDAHVEVVYPLGIQGDHLPDLSRVEEQYPGQYLVRQHEWLKTEANGHWGSYRYLIEPELLTKYVFTPDIELMITKPLMETFLPLMEASGLNYFNTIRPTNVHMVNEHFSEYAALYGHALTPHIPEVRDANSESLLLRIVAHKGNPLPETTDRPVVGKRLMVTG